MSESRMRPSVAEVACPLCESELVSRHLETSSLAVPLWRCKVCTFIFSRGAFEHGHAYHSRRAQLTSRPIATMIDAGFLAWWVTRLQLAVGATLLDVGCAEGRLLELARSMGLDPSGLDVSDHYAGIWAARGIRASVGTLESLADQSGIFDVIVMRQVIEHVPNLVPFFREARRLLAPSGSLIVESGNPWSAQARVLGPRWSFWVPADGAGAHVSFVGVRAAREIASRSGLRLLEWAPHFRSRPYLAYKLEHPGWLAPINYAVHRSWLSGGICFRFGCDGEGGGGASGLAHR